MFAPLIAPVGDDAVYLVEDDFGSIGRVWRETDSAGADRQTILYDLYSGQFNDPVRVIAFNVREGWSRDVSAEFAADLQRRAHLEGRTLGGTLGEFVEFYTRMDRQLSLRLV